MRRRFRSAMFMMYFIIALVAMLMATPVYGQVTMFTDRQSFEAAIPNLTHIDFASALAPGQTLAQVGQLTLKGVNFGGSSLYVIAADAPEVAGNGAPYQGWNTNPTVLQGSAITGVTHVVTLPSGTTAVGTDIYTIQGTISGMPPYVFGQPIDVTLGNGQTFTIQTFDKPILAFAGFRSVSPIASLTFYASTVALPDSTIGDNTQLANFVFGAPCESASCGFDVSYTNSAGSPSLTPAFWQRRMGLDESLAIVEGQGSCGVNQYAQSQLYLARTSGQMRTAGYCFLNYANPTLTGAQQVDTCISLMGQEASTLNFLAVDVEKAENCDNLGISTIAQRITVIKDAITEVLNQGHAAVLYTSRGSFGDVVGSGPATRAFCRMGASLWDATWDSWPDLATNRNRAGQTAVFQPYGGWTNRVGKQFWSTLVPKSSVVGDADIFDTGWLAHPSTPVCR